MAVTQSKKKKVSKKLKSSWRKHVDIKDVEDFLEDQRLDERLGPLTTVPNDALFHVDSTPSLKLLSAKERKKLAASKPLRCFSALQPYTKVPDPIAKRNRVRTKEERISSLIKKKDSLNAVKGLVKAKVRQANMNRELDNSKRKANLKRGEFKTDIWEDENGAKSEEWVETNTKKHNLRGVSLPVKINAKSEKKKNTIPAIELPHPGMSYNPSYQDHQDLLQKVAEKELKLIKEEKHLNRVTRGMFSKVTESDRDKNWLMDMSEGLPSKTEEIKEEESDGEYKSVNPPVQNVKKTLKQKRKKKQHLAQEKLKKAIKLQKKKITDIHNIKTLVKHVEIIDKKQTLHREIQQKNRKLKENKTKVLSAVKFEEPDIEFNLGQEISGNLKDLKTEGNLLNDRFKSMQKRNILAPTKRNKFKKPKVKKFTKPGHKEDNWKKTVAWTGKS